MYLLTNEHVSWCGIYELEIGMMAFESGIDKEDLQKTMLPRLEPKVIYEDGFVFIKNYGRYHSGGKNAEIGRKAAIDELPERIKAKISHILGIGDVGNNPLRGGSPSTSTSTSTSTLTNTSSKEPQAARFSVLGVEIIKAFEVVDPKNKKYYGNITQRTACDFLITEYTLEEVLKRITVLPKTNKVPFFPKIYTPVQLRDKWVDLQDAVERKRGEIKSKANVAFS